MGGCQLARDSIVKFADEGHVRSSARRSFKRLSVTSENKQVDSVDRGQRGSG